MGDTPSYRESNRARLRAALVRAARELTIARGWAEVRMADVARAVGVSRQTVYNEFGGRSGLAEAVVVAEVRHFVTQVRGEFRRHGADARAASYAACRLTLEEAAGNPLVRAILTDGRGGADQLLPFLTTRSGVVLDAAAGVLTEWADEFLPEVPRDRLALAIDAVVRLTISNVVLARESPEVAATALASVFVTLLA